ncbi:TonB family protein [Psychroflexus gondwanensis ACAM 44]|jgi:hypothetical protein|uniref:TonB family protein n=1 Tax=Psychroflexus gondwanensis ACAM 44 TaxID=1189619 RepID=N1WLI2_9FLAO|nr:energy transducer TonB [Psychroflexus gondwanensis]EMY79845.1 TonB family protein [Psychroflexus gondwanensis ACAM 44]
MKQQILILICLLSISICKSQETREVNNSIGEKNEVYNVLKSDPEIRQGKYLLTWNWKYYNSVSEEGQFENNQKQGVWNEYYRFREKYNENDMRVKYLTTYENDKKNGLFVELSYDRDTLQVGRFTEKEKTGIWKRYENGELVEHYDYSINKNLIGIKKNQQEKVDVLPKIIDGDLNSFLIKNLNPVNHKKKKNLLGDVKITMLITKEGIAKDIIVSGADYPELENEFKVALSKSSGNWEPALRNGEKVDVTIFVPIKFLIEWKKKKFRVGMNSGNMKQSE